MHRTRERCPIGLNSAVSEQLPRHIVHRTWAKIKLILREPILAAQSFHPAELTKITGDDDQPPASGMSRDEHIISADRATFALEHRTYLTSVGGRIIVEMEHH
jgi:hypothetical protein